RADNCRVGLPTAGGRAGGSSGCRRSQVRAWNVGGAGRNAPSLHDALPIWTVDTQAPVIAATGTTLALGCNPSPSDINAALGTARAADNTSVGPPPATHGAGTRSG